MSFLDPTWPVRQHIWTVEGLWSPERCAATIARAKELGFDEAMITTHRGQVMRKDVRNNERVFFDDGALATELFEAIRPHVPATLRERHAPPEDPSWRAVGVNERFRVYRYRPGQSFKPHFDGAFVRQRDVEESALTFMIYLDEACDGGETRFLDHEVTVTPKTGTALFFHHAILHEGAEVTAGEKHVLRTDVMYRRA